MSRCFPFPPPGYEKKARPDDESFLAKEKHKEKRGKKDKKGKEKKEGKEKEKKDGERSEEKHREKKDKKETKDKKEKHKDKKDKHRDKETKRTSDEKLGSSCIERGDPNEFKFVVELGKRIRDENRATENHMVQKITLPGQRSAEFPGKLGESDIGNLAEGNEKFNGKRVNGIDRKVYGQSNKVDPKAMENGSVKNFIGGDQRKVEPAAGLVDNCVEKQMEEKEKKKHKNGDSKEKRHKGKDREKKSKSKDKKREKEKKREEKAKETTLTKEQLKPRESDKNPVVVHNIKPSHLSKEINNSSGCKGIHGKRKELERNGFLHDNDIRPIKLPRPVSSPHQVVENGRKLEPWKTAAECLPKWEGTLNNRKVNNKVFPAPPVEENGSKMKSCKNDEANINVSASYPVLENGTKLEPSQTATLLASGRQGIVSNHRVDNKVSLSHPLLENGRKLESCQTAPQLGSTRDWGSLVNNKEHKVNGSIDAQEAKVCSARPSSAQVQVKEKAKVPVKPPHPDTKYLSQILSVPNVEWSGFDDQDWLFGCNDTRGKKPRLDSSQFEGVDQVWAEALRVESADVTALPYVIPY